MRRNKRLKFKGMKRIIICLILLVVIVFEFVAYRSERTKAEQVIDVEVLIGDYDEKLDETKLPLKATYSDNGYYIILPESLDNKTVIKYYAEVPIETTVGLVNSSKDLKVAGVADTIRFSEEVINPEVEENTESDQPTEEPDLTSQEEDQTQETEEPVNPVDTTPAEENLDENTNVENNDEENSEIVDDEVGQEGEDLENPDENPEEEPTEEDIIEDEVISEDLIEQDKVIKDTRIIEVLPKEKLYLTTEQVENKSVKITVKYDSKTVNDVELYKQTIDTKIDLNTAQVTGYLPDKAEVVIETQPNEIIADTVNETLEENDVLTTLFMINVVVDGKTFDLDSYGEELTVTIMLDSIEEDYQVFEIESQSTENVGLNIKKGKTPVLAAPNELGEKTQTNETMLDTSIRLADLDDEINPDEVTIKQSDAVLKPDSITFNASTSKAYAIVRGAAVNGTETNTIEDVVISGSQWDGTIATSFSAGTGDLSSPYLILDGSELAYLAQQVNNGTNYAGKYFQLVGDIDLNGRTWTPIGTNANSFSGIFDGAGHSISNCTIETPSSVSGGTSYSYGIFGSIMGVSTTAEIRNTEFNNISVTISKIANNVQMKVGIVTGTMYKKTKISNVLVKSGSITSGTSFTISNNNVLVAVGGIAGEARNTSSSTTDPGDGNRYSIENCYVTLTINTSNFTCGTVSSGGFFGSSYEQGTYVTQVSNGGIIGRIRSQNVWPQNCFVDNLQVTATGMVGPIFGGVYNNTAVTSGANLDTFWQGNDAAGGNNLTMTSYYNTYRVNNSTFTSSYTSGTTPVSTTYRRGTTQSRGSGNNITYYVNYVQGINKASRLTNDTTMLNNFNTYNVNNLDNNVIFTYANDTFSLQRRFTAGINDNGDYTYTITVNDPYNIGTYSYAWYINGVLDETKLSDTAEIRNESFTDKLPVKVIVSDGTYYSVVKFAVPKLYVEIEFTIDYTDMSNIKLIAEITGPRNTI